MLRFLLRSFVICCMLHMATIATAAPYCNVNETIIKTKPILRTRLIERKPTGPFKIFKKTKLITEEYVDYESYTEFKVKHVCCEGYLLSERLRICEPVCAGEHKCPENAVCFEPNQCKCRDGYGTKVADIDAKQMICKPICSEACPDNGHCAKPNMCECERGYRAEAGKCIAHCASGCPHEGRCMRPNICECNKGYLESEGTCKPICERGQGCLNGKCVDTEECVCNKGYKKNPRTEVCEAMQCVEGESDCIADAGFEGETTTEEIFESSESVEAIFGAPIDEADNELDENENIYLYSSNTSNYTVICAPNLIYNNGQCREALATNDQVDCSLKPCTDNAICQENGICACIEGYTWYKPIVTADVTQNSITTAVGESKEYSEEESAEIYDLESTDSIEDSHISNTEGIAAASAEIIEMVPICVSVQELNALLATAEAEDDDADSFLGIFFIALGVACIVCAALFLITKLLHHQRGSITVETKNDLCCEYDNKSFNEKQMVL